jgi:hypothetical protein
VGVGDREVGTGGREAATCPLPCLNSHSSNEEEPQGDWEEQAYEPEPEGDKAPWNILRGSQRKTAFCLRENLRAMVKLYGVERVLFATFTFTRDERCKDQREASRRWNSFMTGWLRKRVADYIAVPERHRDGRVHFHAILATTWDVGQATFDHQAVANRQYGSVSAPLRAFWKELRVSCPRYGFGRSEAQPVRTTAEQVSAYVGKYVSKNIDARSLEDVGVRLVRYSKGLKAKIDFLTANAFAFNSPRSWLWRRKVAQVAERLGFKSTADFREHFGQTWACTAGKLILSSRLGCMDDAGGVKTVYPSMRHALADGKGVSLTAEELSGLPQGEVHVEQSPRSEDWCAENLDVVIAELRAAFACERIKSERETWERERIRAHWGAVFG